MVWGLEHCFTASCVDLTSALRSPSIWSVERSLGRPGLLRRGETGQAGNWAAKSPHGDWQWDSVGEWGLCSSLPDKTRPAPSSFKCRNFPFFPFKIHLTISTYWSYITCSCRYTVSCLCIRPSSRQYQVCKVLTIWGAISPCRWNLRTTGAHMDE